MGWVQCVHLFFIPIGPGPGWSAGNNRWSQLFRWPGKSSNRPGTKNCAAHQKYSMDEKKAGDYTLASLWLDSIFTNFSKQWPRPETVDFHFDVSFAQIFAGRNGSRMASRPSLIDSLFRSTFSFFPLPVYRCHLFPIFHIEGRGI